MTNKVSSEKEGSMKSLQHLRDLFEELEASIEALGVPNILDSIGPDIIEHEVRTVIACAFASLGCFSSDNSYSVTDVLDENGYCQGYDFDDDAFDPICDYVEKALRLTPYVSMNECQEEIGHGISGVSYFVYRIVSDCIEDQDEFFWDEVTEGIEPEEGPRGFTYKFSVSQLFSSSINLIIDDLVHEVKREFHMIKIGAFE